MSDRWTHAVCEADWVAQRSTRGPLGNVISVDRPARAVGPADGPTPPAETCCVCGAVTIVGIYLRGDAAEFLCGGDPGWGPVHAGE